MIYVNTKMPIGIEDFKQLRDGHYYFVDKTDFIRQLIDNHSAVTLITRPRRFGKTLTLSMLDYFFSKQKATQSRNLFQDLIIAQTPAYMSQRGQYPVLFFSLKEFTALNWHDMSNEWREFLQDLFLQHTYLRDAKRVQPELIAKYQAIIDQKANSAAMSKAIALLMNMMQQYYGRRVILLIDEYDAPIQLAWEYGYYEQCIAFMKRLLSTALKTNPNLDFAVLTGVLRVAKESIFSGLNNFKTCSVLDDKYSNIFGFTADETQLMFQQLHLENKLAEAQSWYDGYHIGQQEIYNPWSILNYVDSHCQPRAYWVHTSANNILRFLLQGANALQISMIQNLLQGEAINVTLNDSIIYPEIGQDKSALFTMLLTTGYLTVKRTISAEDDRYALSIPNKEIRKLYSTEILSNMSAENSRDSFDTLFEFLLNGNAEYFSMQLQQILLRFISIYDATNKESFYHGFMLGMTALFLGRDYIIESNRESGYGRFDLAIFPKNTKKAGVIMEFKVATSEKELATKAKEALQQIENRQYITEFEKRNIKTVWKYGIAFCGKKICVAN